MNAIATANHRPMVLIVDDEDGVCALLERWARDCGVDVAVAASADEALDIMRTTRVDLAICDVMMPGHDGLWLVEQLRAMFAYTSIALATAVPEIDPRVSLQEGVVGYLLKPFSRAVFENILVQGIADCGRRWASAGVPACGACVPDHVIDGEVVEG